MIPAHSHHTPASIKRIGVFGGTFDPEVARAGAKANTTEKGQSFSYKTRKYLTSGGKQYVPDGRPGHHSPFATVLLGALKTTTQQITSKEMFEQVKDLKPRPQSGTFGNNEKGSLFHFYKSQH